MTGFGRAQADLGNDIISLEVTSVNKKNLEVVISSPREWHAFEVHASKLLKSMMHRGRIRISISIEHQKNETLPIFDKPKLNSDLAQFKDLIQEYCGSTSINPATILEFIKLRNLDSMTLPSYAEAFKTLDFLLREATTNLLRMRKEEGKTLKNDLMARINIIDDLMPKIKSKGNDMAKELTKKLLQRLGDAGLSLDLDDERVLKEVSIFAEKSDISEEITRVNSHIHQLRMTLEQPESIGRKIEFLLQEIGRELNTISSKSIRIECTRLVLDARAELDKLREQSLNVE